LEPPPYLVPHSQEPIRVLYRDADLLIVDKPTLLLSVPGRHPLNKDCLIHRLERHFPGVMGLVDDGTGTISLPLAADWPKRPRQKVCFDTGKTAITHWRVLSREHNTTLLELKPETGRSHQLRIHLSEIGHPILGCDFYATEAALRAAPRLLLHASRIRLRHPMTGHTLTGCSPPRCMDQYG
jgi:tRNA pseudouridine32 synthase/23S rRNA pseudouridine746 synthase